MLGFNRVGTASWFSKCGIMKIRMKKVYLCLIVSSMFLFLCVGGAWADQRFTDDADAIEKAADSVFMLEIYSKNNQKIGVGSGFVAFDDSLLVTNYHVIEGGSYIIAISDEYDQYLLNQVCIMDKGKDIAILRFEESHVAEPLEMDGESRLKRAQPVVAIGSPAGLMNTVSIGNISAFYKKEGRDWIQFTAPISSGSSGGPLLNDNGKVIGITTATYASTQNINMAVRAENVVKLYKAWDGKTTVSMDGRKTTTLPTLAIDTNSSSEESAVVYISGSGKKYHNNPQCSGMRNAKEIDLLEAIEKGYQPCGKCYK